MNMEGSNRVTLGILVLSILTLSGCEKLLKNCLGLYALNFIPQATFARGQTLYAFRQSIFVQSIP